MQKKIDLQNKTIAISRTDSIGDVVLTLPMCIWLKEQYPSCRVVFVGRAYTAPVVAACSAVDVFYNWDEIAAQPPVMQVQSVKSWGVDVFVHVFPDKEIAKVVKKAKITHRIGTSHRSYHLVTCNHRINFTRKKADEHEAQLNFHLLKEMGCTDLPELKQIQQWIKPLQPEALNHDKFSHYFRQGKHTVLHPKSKGSALEWDLVNYIKLAEMLADKGFRVFFTGTQAEGDLFSNQLPQHPNIQDLSGVFSLSEFMSFLSAVDLVVGCSTGPLHLASIFGTPVVGLYPATRPMHPGRWQPIGEKVHILVDEKSDKKRKQLEISVDSVTKKCLEILA